MIFNLKEDEYRKLIKELNNNDETRTNLKSDFDNHKKHDSYVTLKMISEDGNNEFQGLISAELYNLSDGLAATVNTLLIPDKFLDKEYANVLIYHLVENVKEKFKDCKFINVITDEDNKKLYEENGFEVTSNGRFSKAKGKFLNIRLINEL